jgi:general stress protein 26
MAAVALVDPSMLAFLALRGTAEIVEERARLRDENAS